VSAPTQTPDILPIMVIGFCVVSGNMITVPIIRPRFLRFSFNALFESKLPLAILFSLAAERALFAPICGFALTTYRAQPFRNQGLASSAVISLFATSSWITPPLCRPHLRKASLTMHISRLAPSLRAPWTYPL
jgi:hypothetical protein